MSGDLVRHVSKRAERFPAVTTSPESLIRRVDQRPSPHAIPSIDREEDWQPPSEVLGSGATDIYRYLGVVEEVHDDGRVLATLWQHPGIEMISELIVDEHFGGVRPAPLDVIQAWAWTECPGGNAEIHRLYARCIQRDERPDAEASLDEILSILRSSRSHET